MFRCVALGFSAVKTYDMCQTDVFRPDEQSAISLHGNDIIHEGGSSFTKIDLGKTHVAQVVQMWHRHCVRPGRCIYTQNLGFELNHKFSNLGQSGSLVSIEPRMSAVEQDKNQPLAAFIWICFHHFTKHREELGIVQGDVLQGFQYLPHFV